MEHAPAIKERKRSIIEIASATCIDPNPVSTVAGMRLGNTLTDPTQYDCDANRLVTSTANVRYPMRDLYWRADIVAHDESRDYPDQYKH